MDTSVRPAPCHRTLLGDGYARLYTGIGIEGLGAESCGTATSSAQRTRNTSIRTPVGRRCPVPTNRVRFIHAYGPCSSAESAGTQRK